MFSIRSLCKPQDAVGQVFDPQVDVSPPVDYELFTKEDKRAGWVFGGWVLGIGTVIAGLFTLVLLSLPHLPKWVKWIGGLF